MEHILYDWVVSVVGFALAHGAFLVSLLSLCIALGTCYCSYKAAKAAGKQAELSRLDFISRNRPHVLVYFKVLNDATMCLCVENFGNEPAQNVKIRVNPTFIENVRKVYEREDLSNLNKADHLFLSPGQRFYYIFGGIRQFKQVASVVAEVKIEYQSAESEAHQYSDQITIDLNQYGGALLYDSALEEIAKQGKSCGTNLQKLGNILNKTKTR